MTSWTVKTNNNTTTSKYSHTKSKTYENWHVLIILIQGVWEKHWDINLYQWKWHVVVENKREETSTS